MSAWGGGVHGWVPAPARSLRPIVRPGCPPWAPAIVSQVPGQGGGWWLLAAVVFLIAGMAPGMAIGLAGSPEVGLPLTLVPFAGVIGAFVRYRHDVVAGPGFRYEGVPLNATALDMLEDIQGRFDFAHRLVDEVPTGIAWSEVASHVDVLLWECAGHAARLSTLDVEVHELRYAASDTPQAALLNKLLERRREHWTMLVDAQHEADALAREAGNAVASAKVALARTGSMRALEIVSPSPRAMVAKGALAEARLRLSMLSEAWAELDESGELLAQRLELDKGTGGGSSSDCD